METPTETNIENDNGNRATYCPEDNKLRLYIGRVPRDEYLKLKAEGWQALYKQREAGQGDFAAIWTPSRRDTALEYAGIIEDEDMGPAERAADRAERFAVYREKRLGEATEQADHFDAGPIAHGYQSQARADRAARRHDAIAGRACDSWRKAEYWQSRTAGVISHALHKAAPGVRVGRVKEIEAEIRKREAAIEESETHAKLWGSPNLTHEQARLFAGAGWFNLPRKAGDRDGFTPTAYDLLKDPPSNLFVPRTLEEITATILRGCERSIEYNTDWILHLRLRIAYEMQMIGEQGGRAAFIEMEVGGWIGSKQIRKVNKSNASGRVVSVQVMGVSKGFSRRTGYTKEEILPALVTINIERASVDSYRPPTEEDKKVLEALIKAEKEAAPKAEPCPLINPTEEDAKKLQEKINSAPAYYRYKPSEPVKLTFAQYTGRGRVETICELGQPHRSRYGSNITRSDVFKVRMASRDYNSAPCVVILTDKPQKGIPWAAVEKAKAAAPSVEKLFPRMAELVALVLKFQSWSPRTPAEQQLLRDAEYIGWVDESCSTPHWTEAGMEARKRYESEGAKAAILSAGESLA